ncbi:MAG TPA: DUF559 domain-containing protein [Candidatus Dormibacteraeota bacterium]
MSIELLHAAQLRLPASAAFSGLTAAWLHGLDVDGFAPIELTVPDRAGVSARSGLCVRRAVLPCDEVVEQRGFRTTSMPRTLSDLSGRLSLTEAVVVADLALRRRASTLDELAAHVASHAGRKGNRRLRRVAALAEPRSESQMESRLRILLVAAGLPRAEAQVTLTDEGGRQLGRVDLYYPQRRLAIEYDGGNHRERLVEDNRRQNLIQKAGITILRFTSADVYGAPDLVAALVGSALGYRVRPRRFSDKVRTQRA